MDYKETSDERRLSSRKNVAVIVAHPDDETLWAGGTLLSHCRWHVFIVCLCEGDDQDRVAKFKKMLTILHAEGEIGNMDNGAVQNPLRMQELEKTICHLLPLREYDLIITHDSSGEYRHHRRHTEVSHAVITLWNKNQLKTNELWTFAYTDENGKFHPRAIKKASIRIPLTLPIYAIKHEIIHVSEN